MINHTMIVSFTDTPPDAEIDQFLKEMEQLMRDSGLVQTFTGRRAIRVPGDDHSPVFAASAIVQIGYSGLDDLNASFTTPGLAEFIQRWQSRHPYKPVWANHEPL